MLFLSLWRVKEQFSSTYVIRLIRNDFFFFKVNRFFKIDFIGAYIESIKMTTKVYPLKIILLISSSF